VVGEAVMLLFRVVDHEAELNALAGKLAVGQAAEPGENGGEARLGRGVHDDFPRLATLAPLLRHPGKVVDEEVSDGAEIFDAARAMAAGAILGAEVARRTVA